MLVDSGLESISTILDLKSRFSKNIIESLINKQTYFPNLNTIVNNQKIIDTLKNVDLDFSTYHKYEKELDYFFQENSSIEKLEEDTFGQLIFQHESLKVFNFIPYLLFFLSYFKIFFIPLVSIVMPLAAYFLPYLLIKYVF